MGMAIAGAATSLFGGVMSAVGSLKAGKQEQAVDDYNAKVFEEQSKEAQASGDKEAADIEKYGVSLVASQRASAARAGVSAGGGSALDIMLDSATNIESDINTSKYNTKINVQRLNSEAYMQHIAGQQARTQSEFNAGMTLIQTGSQIMSNFGGGSASSFQPVNMKSNTSITLPSQAGLGNSAGGYMSSGGNNYATGSLGYAAASSYGSGKYAFGAGQ